MRRLLIALALVVAFQAGRLLPAEDIDRISPRTAAAFAQAVDACGREGALANEEECKLIQGLMDKIAVTSLERLGAQIAQRTEALRPQVRAALETAAQQRLGDEVATLHAQIAETKALMERTANTLTRTKRTLDQSDNVIDESDEVIDESKRVLDDTEEVLDDTEEALNRTEDLLNRTNALGARLQEDLARINRLVDLLQGALPRQ